MKDELETRSYVRRFLFLLHFGRCSIICWLQSYSTVKGPSVRSEILRTTFSIKKILGIGTASLIYLPFLNLNYFISCKTMLLSVTLQTSQTFFCL